MAAVDVSRHHRRDGRCLTSPVARPALTMAARTLTEGTHHIEDLFRKWIRRLPFPLSEQDMVSGYRHEISVWQCEFSRTQVFDRPMRGREFFECVIRENIDLGRPDRVQLLFDRKIIKSTPGSFRSRIITRGVSPSLHVEYKSTDIKQYFKENRAARTDARSTTQRTSASTNA